MALIVKHTDICKDFGDGFVKYDIVENTDIQVYTKAGWKPFSKLWNDKGTALLEPTEDPEGDLIIGMQVDIDLDWGSRPQGPEAAYISFMQGVQIKNYVFWRMQEDGDGNPIPCTP